MANNAPGKHFRKGLSLPQIFRMFPDDSKAEQWFVKQRWQGDISCPYCGSLNVQIGTQHKSMPYRCREKECDKRFSVRTGTVMQSSKLSYQVWVIAMYLLSTNLKSVSSMKLHRDLNITQKSAWHLAHRLRKAADHRSKLFNGPLELDETFVGGSRKNMPNSKRRLQAGRGPVGKTVIVGAKDRDTNNVSAKVIKDTDRPTLQGFIEDTALPGATVYTDDATAYRGMSFEHKSVKHSLGEYVKGDSHTNGIESFWSMFKRAYKGTFHHLSAKHLNRYITEFSGRHNVRDMDTIDQMAHLARGMERKRLTYKNLIS